MFVEDILQYLYYIYIYIYMIYIYVCVCVCVLCDKDGIKWWVCIHMCSVRRHVTVLLYFLRDFEEVSDTARLPLLLLFF